MNAEELSELAWRANLHLWGAGDPDRSPVEIGTKPYEVVDVSRHPGVPDPGAFAELQVDGVNVDELEGNRTVDVTGWRANVRRRTIERLDFLPVDLYMERNR